MIETPHTVTLKIPAVNDLPEGFAAAPESAGTVSLKVQITPKTAAFALENYGVDVTKAAKMMGNVDDEPYFQMQGALLIWERNNRLVEFEIKSGVRYHGQGDDCDHISVILEEVRGNS